jgi:hypothetical protein
VTEKSQYVVFDLETENIPGPLNLDRRVPGITVGATLASDGDLRLWYDRASAGDPSGALLTPDGAGELLRYLTEAQASGHTVVTWNGAGFDFRVLAQASGLVDECVELAWAHLDLMFWFHCRNGYSVGLDKAARAVGSGKTEGMTGADAPRLWDAGEYQTVLEYVAQDVRALAAVHEEAARGRALRWVNSRGRVSRAAGPVLTVREAYKLPAADTSWMRRAPWPRTKFVGWMLARGREDRAPTVIL